MTLSDRRKYFSKKKANGGIFLLGVGLAFLVPMFIYIAAESRIATAILARNAVFLVIPAIMVVIGICMIARFKSRVSARKLDEYCNNLCRDYFSTRKVMAESQFDKVFDGVYSSGYCFENFFSARYALQGKDGNWRSSILDMSCVFFSEGTAYYYSNKQSLITDEKFETQKAFRLQDVTMVSIEQPGQAVAVAITIQGGNTVYINCRSNEEAIRVCGIIKDRVRPKLQNI